MTTPAAPSVPCSNCNTILTVVDDCCGRCGKTFAPRELWETYLDLVRIGSARFAK